MNMVLTFLGRDDWSRPVYKGDNGKIYVDVDPLASQPSIHTKSSNDFDGEPDRPVNAEFTFIPKRDTW